MCIRDSIKVIPVKQYLETDQPAFIVEHRLWVRRATMSKAHKNTHRPKPMGTCEGAGTWTLDLRIKSPLLYQLSYTLNMKLSWMRNPQFVNQSITLTIRQFTFLTVQEFPKLSRLLLSYVIEPFSRPNDKLIASNWRRRHCHIFHV